MSNFDLSKPAPDRTRFSEGSGAGGLGLTLIGIVVVLVVLYGVFGGAAFAPTQESATPAEATIQTPAE